MSLLNPMAAPIAANRSLIGNMSCIAVDSALYSASMVETAISCWSLLAHTIGHPLTQMTHPVLDFIQEGSLMSSRLYNPAKSASM